MTASSYTMAYRYDACGETLDTYTATSGAVDSPWRYQGRVRETASTAPDVYDFSARSYDPGLGAFTSFDSVTGSAQNPLTLNRYLYANANPATLVDPDGHTTAADCGQNPSCLAALYGTNSTSTSASGSSSRAAAQKARFNGEAQANREWANYKEAHLGSCVTQSCVDWYLNQKTDNQGPAISHSDMAWYGRMLGKAQEAADAAYQHAAKTTYGNANQSYVGGQWVGGSESYDLKSFQASHPMGMAGNLAIAALIFGSVACLALCAELLPVAVAGATDGGAGSLATGGAGISLGGACEADCPETANALETLMAEADSAAGNVQWVVRGGRIESIANQIVDSDGYLSNLSVNSLPGMSWQELTNYPPVPGYGSASVTTLQQIQNMGGSLTPDRLVDNPAHALINSISPADLQSIMTNYLKSQWGG
jgi:RHS repeat-associated protein